MCRLICVLRMVCLVFCFASSWLAFPSSVQADASSFYPECTHQEAVDLEHNANTPAEWYKAAACFAAVVINDSGGDRLTNARAGRALAKKAVNATPTNGTYQYLLSVLIGFVAETDPLWDKMTDGMQLVPMIEKHALKAVQYAPGVDDGGPERVLGELYSQAPGPPMSIGDQNKSLEYFQKAVKISPYYLQNRLELAGQLKKMNRKKEACEQVDFIRKTAGPASVKKKAESRFGDMCPN